MTSHKNNSANLYDGELAPAVRVDGKRIFDSDDLTAGLLYLIAGQAPGEVFSAEQAQELLEEQGFDTTGTATTSKIRSAMNKIDMELTTRNKQRHVILRSAGQRNLLFGLTDAPLRPARRP